MSDITNQQLLEAMTEQLSVITDNMVTKEDLKEALKNELKPYATKDDLKEALKPYATKDDLKQTEARLEVKLNRLDRKLSSNNKANMNHHLEVRAMIGDLNKRYAQFYKD